MQLLSDFIQLLLDLRAIGSFLLQSLLKFTPLTGNEIIVVRMLFSWTDKIRYSKTLKYQNPIYNPLYSLQERKHFPAKRTFHFDVLLSALDCKKSINFDCWALVETSFTFSSAWSDLSISRCSVMALFSVNISSCRSLNSCSSCSRLVLVVSSEDKVFFCCSTCGQRNAYWLKWTTST